MDTQAWVCTQRVPNFREAENVQPSEAKARRTLPSARAWLWMLQTRSPSSRRSARTVSFAFERLDSPPPRGSSLVCMYDGGESLIGG